MADPLTPIALTNRKEHGSELGKPVGIDRGYALHVLFGRQNKLVINHVVGRKASTKQGARRMQVALHARTAVDVLANALQTRRLMEIGRTDTFSTALSLAEALSTTFVLIFFFLPDDIPIGTTRNVGHLHGFHDINQLCPYFAGLAHRLGMHKVLRTPVIPIAVDTSWRDENLLRWEKMQRRNLLVALPLGVNVQEG